jgi:multiple sugar transport system substrate-binding protein
MRRKTPIFVSAGLAGALALTGCGQAGQGETTTAEGRTQLTMWTHSAGNPAELEVYERIISDFNASQDEYEVVNESFPQGAYNDAIVAAAASGDLPCLLDLDGPIMPNWAWAGYLQPLELPTELTDSLLPTAVGVWDDQIYSAGYWDAALAIFARASVLEANGIRIPTIEEPWSKDEFGAVLATLKASGYETPIDIGAEDTGEWWPYAYSPMLQSFGGDLINREDYKSAEGVLNGPEGVEWARWFRSLVTDGLVPLKSGADPAKDFINGKTGILYNGTWTAVDTRKAFKEDTLFLPPPDLGTGPKIGGGSWQWGISQNCGCAGVLAT